MALTTILYEQTLELVAGSLSYVEAEMPLVIGEPYIVNWDGVEYECVAIEMTMNGSVLPYLGNPLIAVGGEDNGLPFVVGYAPAEVTGTYEMFGIATNSEGTHTVAVYTKAIFPVWPLSGFAFNDYYGAYMVSIPDTPFTIPAIGETCVVKWDGVAYTCVVQDASAMGEGAIGLGNATALGGSGNNEPFVIGWMSGDMAIIAFDTETSHTVGIYPEDTADEEPGEEPEEPEEETTVGIVLKDRDGNDVIYPGTLPIRLNTSDGGTKKFVAAETVEKTVDLDFSSGDMVVTPDPGTLFKNVSIPKPGTLLPINIAKDVEIAGVVGVLEAGGGGGIGEHHVQVIDYNGTVLSEGYLNEGDTFYLPSPPTHDRLVFDGWSATVEVVDGAVTVEDFDITVGAMYHTASGATEVDISLTQVTGLTFTFNDVLINKTSIDWGDGSTDNTLTHTYSDYGEYTIKIYGMTSIASTGSSLTMAASASSKIIKKVLLSNSMTTIGTYAFYQYYGIRELVIPNSITSIGASAFNSCTALKALVLPNSIESIPNSMCVSNQSMEIAVIPYGVTTVGGNVFWYCYSLRVATLPNSVQSIGQNVYDYCQSLRYARIPKGVTQINGLFARCCSLKSITVPESVTDMNGYNFTECRGLKTVRLPSRLTTFKTYEFNYCIAIESIVVPEGVTELGIYAFAYCWSLKSIVMPSSLKNIGMYALRNLTAIEVLDFSRCTQVPTLYNSSVLTGLSSVCQILVPSALYDKWKSATNWTSYASKIIPV